VAGTAQREARVARDLVAVSIFLLMGIDVRREGDFANGRHIRML
jgi:hypothetical protein